MVPSSYDIPLHDIKPLMEVPESSFTFFVVGVVVLSVLVVGSGYLLYQHFKKSKVYNQRKADYKALKKVDFKASKSTAYEITKYGRTFADDSERLFGAYQNLVERLEIYKYRPEVDEIDAESRSYYKIYLEMIDV